MPLGATLMRVRIFSWHKLLKIADLVFYNRRSTSKSLELFHISRRHLMFYSRIHSCNRRYFFGGLLELRFIIRTFE